MSWAHYLLQANIYLVVFYAFYSLLLAKESYFKLNRIYMVTAGLLAMLLPYLQIDWLYTTENNDLANRMNDLSDLITQGAQASDQTGGFALGNLLALVYLTGFIFFCFRLMYRLIKVNQFLKTNSQGAAFSFFNRRVIDDTLPGFQTIEYHERVHSRQWHTLDVLLFEMLAILCWFNPIIYLYKKSIKSIHEYLADEEAAQFIGDKQQYALLLLSKSFGVPLSSLTHSFHNQSLLKNRIMMLDQEKSPKKALLKYGVYLPVFGLTLLLSSATLRNDKHIKEFSETIPLEKPILLVENMASPQIASVGKIIAQDTVKIDEQPHFVGGMTKFYEYLSKSVKYPKEAVKNNIEGKVYLSFIVEKNGALSDIKVQRKLGGGTDEEAVRVLAASPRWVPGKIAGEPVRVEYNLPITFTLSKKPTDSSTIKTVRLVGQSDNSAIKPLIYVDGIKSDQAVMNTINSADITSVQVFKNEKALAIYGEEGKNGVIEITTKAAVAAKAEKAAEANK